uniref:ATP binding cassette subfamily F member 2 n=1 Tax=Macaca nemestrina TaxID=9545 RepID=A0A2K6DKA7_MACNE
MTSDSFSRLHRKFGSVRSRQSPSGLETSWLTRSTSSPSWWMRSPSSPRGPTTCEPSTWARVRSSIWELTAATLTSRSGQDPGATLLHCCNTAPPASPLPLNLP